MEVSIWDSESPAATVSLSIFHVAVRIFFDCSMDFTTISHPADSTALQNSEAISEFGINLSLIHICFDGLLPSGRSDLGKPRKLDDSLQEQIRYLKVNYPRMPAAAIFRQLKDSGSIRGGEVSESTVTRYIKLLAAQMKTSTHPDMRRYERPHINEVWCGDSSVGPYLHAPDGKKRKVFILALIDDASRFIVGIDIFFNDNFVNLMSVMKSAVAKYGRPQLFNFDNGSSYKNRQMELLAARIGSAIHYNQPYTPTQKAKIERWFRTMKDQWMASLDIRDFHSIEELDVYKRQFQ